MLQIEALNAAMPLEVSNAPLCCIVAQIIDDNTPATAAAISREWLHAPAPGVIRAWPPPGSSFFCIMRDRCPVAAAVVARQKAKSRTTTSTSTINPERAGGIQIRELNLSKLEIEQLNRENRSVRKQMLKLKQYLKDEQTRAKLQASVAGMAPIGGINRPAAAAARVR